jgi:hypothetical protein
MLRTAYVLKALVNACAAWAASPDAKRLRTALIQMLALLET